MMPVNYGVSAGGTQESVARVEALARLMDGAFVLPGTNIRLGLDSIIGLVPVAGDVISGLVSSYLIWEARQLGAPQWLIARMVANTLLDLDDRRYPCDRGRFRHHIPRQHEEHGPIAQAHG